jgi:hypothetical protein
MDRWWLNFAADLHIPPWRIGDLTYRQLRQAEAFFEQQQREAQARG